MSIIKVEYGLSIVCSICFNNGALKKILPSAAGVRLLLYTVSRLRTFGAARASFPAIAALFNHLKLISMK